MSRRNWRGATGLHQRDRQLPVLTGLLTGLDQPPEKIEVIGVGVAAGQAPGYGGHGGAELLQRPGWPEVLVAQLGSEMPWDEPSLGSSSRGMACWGEGSAMDAANSSGSTPGRYPPGRSAGRSRAPAPSAPGAARRHPRTSSSAAASPVRRPCHADHQPAQAISAPTAAGRRCAVRCCAAEITQVLSLSCSAGA